MGARIHEKLREGGQDGAALAALLALPESSADWKQPGDALLNHAGDEVWRITCQASLMSDYDYQQLTSELNAIAAERLQTCAIGRPQHVVTGLIPIFLRTQQALLDSLVNSFGLAFVLIGGMMIVLLRNVSAALWSMLPNVMPIAIVFGLLGWSGIRVDIGTMITASIALGIAVDGTLHLMTWFRNLIAQGISREEAVVQALEHCGPALWQTSAAIGFGMLMLYPVELLLISRFGWIMCTMIFAALWGDVILLPGLLAGPLGRVLEKSVRSQSKSQGEDDVPPIPRVIPALEPEPVLLPAEPVVPERRVASAVTRKPHFPRIGSVFPRRVTES
jgi:hypothetical protein